jgi:hypothetical protein
VVGHEGLDVAPWPSFRWGGDEGGSGREFKDVFGGCDNPLGEGGC